MASPGLSPPARAARAPEPLAAAPRERLAALRWVLTDIDDTLTSGGRLTAAAYAAMERLAAAGVAVVPVTGRPAGWCDLIARLWPVAAVVGENGALWYAYDPAARRMRRWQAGASDRARLLALAERAMAAVPGTALAADQPFRVADVAVDFREDVATPLPLAAAERVAAVFRAGGAAARISSIHVNAWFGAWDKWSGLERLFAALWRPLPEALGEVAYLGDSPNDAPLFARIPLSVGVANVAPFLSHMDARPAYVTRAAAGAGFVEFAEAVLAARSHREETEE
ncbi:HAD-IIB family hydrolase [Caldovatus aquaticus]|uniref:HAD-IIB family hydrolase n=1 Tax=Caldovatus aquaticus TaxID=2865671 RepID=A0ABS7F1G8_9PROT|nr:HAD-IIB family hydrolase [Caldovatus aquaticus]MBW8269463.1 HAD-IIB family hydrolase [Caldovatus aquaticus]